MQASDGRLQSHLKAAKRETGFRVCNRRTCLSNTVKSGGLEVQGLIQEQLAQSSPKAASSVAANQQDDKPATSLARKLRGSNINTLMRKLPSMDAIEIEADTHFP